MMSFHDEITQKMEQQRQKVEQYKADKAIKDTEERRYKDEQNRQREEKAKAEQQANQQRQSDEKKHQEELELKRQEMNFKHNLLK